MNKIKIISLLLFLSLFLISDASSYSDLVPVKNKNGMYQAEFKLDRGGAVKVNLPSDMALKENVSGSMMYKGNLSQFELLVENKLVPMSGNNFNFIMPSNVTTGVVNVLLRFSNGIDIGRAFFPINIVKLKDFTSESDENAFKLPVYGSSGIPVDVEGAFDGNYRNTIVTLSGKRLNVLAESTTRTVFITSNDHSGPGVLKLSELGKNAQTKFTNLVVVKVEERVQEPETILGYEQKGFEENEFTEISEPVALSSQKLNKEKVLPVLTKSKLPKSIGNQDNTLLKENPAAQAKVASVKKEVPFKQTTIKTKKTSEKKEVAVKNEANKTQVVAVKKETSAKNTVTKNKSLDYSAIKNDLDKQFSSKFYSNEASDIKKKEVVASKPDLEDKTIIAKGSSLKVDTSKPKETVKTTPKNTSQKTVIAKADSEKSKIKTDKKEIVKVSQKTPETKKVAALPPKKNKDLKDFEEVKKDLNKQFFSKLNSPEKEKKEIAKVETKKEKAPVPSKKTIEKKKVVKSKDVKKEPLNRASEKGNKKVVTSKTEKKVDKQKVTNTSEKKVDSKAAKKVQDNKDVDKIAKNTSRKPAVTNYQPLVEAKDSKIEKANKKQNSVKSKKNEDKLKSTQFIHTVVPEVVDKKKTAKSSEVKKESSKLVSKNKLDKKDTDVKAGKEKISKSKSTEKIKDTKLVKSNQKKQTVKKDKGEITKSLKKSESKTIDKKAMHTVMPKAVSKKTEVAKAKKEISSKKPPSKNKKSDFCIQLASFKKQSEVNTFLSKMKSSGYNPDVKQVRLPKKGRWNRVRICDFDSRPAAENFSKGINKSSLNISSVLVTEY